MTLWTVACQAPLPMGFSRQEYWSGLPCPSPWIFPTQGLNQHLLHILHWQAGSLPLKSTFNSRDITLLTKIHIVKTMVFAVVMYECETWTRKKTECQRIDALELWCWRRLLRVPWTARRSNQSILKENSPEYSLEGLVLKLML